MNRLKELRLKKGKLQEEVGTIIGVSGRAIGNYETGKREMSPEILLKLSDYFNVSVDYLLGKTESPNSQKKFYMCPVYGRISAGQPNWVEECIEGRIPLDYELMNITNPEECFFLKVNGESMNKVISNGAYALIRKTDFVDDGKIAVVLVNNDEATLKKFSKQGDFIVLEPMSTDSSFTMQIYNKNTSIKVIGEYIGKFEMN